MTETSADEPELSTSLLEQVFELWVEPELGRSGLQLDRDGVRQALVIMAPGRRVKTLINGEAELVATVRATGPIEAGAPVTTSAFDEIHHLRPHEVDPDAGWVCFVRIGSQVVIAFDFRRNRSRAGRLVERAREFSDAARLALSTGLLAPALENAFASAELAVVAQMLLIHEEAPSGHPARRRWFVGWTDLGNAPVTHSKALSTLAKQRRRARYAEGDPSMGPAAVEKLVDTVDEIIEHADSQVSHEPGSQDSERPSD